MDEKKMEQSKQEKEIYELAGLSLIQAKYAAMIEGKKIRHSSFMDDEYIYYKNGCWFTHHDCQMPEVCFLNDQEQGW